MRVGIDARLWGESGVGRYIRNLVFNLKTLDKHNDYILFVGSNFNENSKFKIQNSKWKIVTTDIHWHTLEEQFKFPQLLNKENLDLVHFPYFSVPLFYNGSFVVTIHDLILHHYPTGEASTLSFPLYQTKHLGYRFVISKAARRAKKVIAVSNATKDEIIDHLGVRSDKIVVTYEGVDDALNAKRKTQNANLQLKTKNFFLYVGNAYPHKNLGRLVEAVAMIRDEGLTINLVLVGKEDYFYQRLKKKVKRMNLEKHVTFLGSATDEELGWLYKNAKATIVPALMEGFSLPALEAMMSGCVVLASDIPALREICAEAAWYFDPQETEDIARKLREALTENAEHFQKATHTGLERAKMFSWKQMAQQTLKIYEEAIKEKT